VPRKEREGEETGNEAGYAPKVGLLQLKIVTLGPFQLHMVQLDSFGGEKKAGTVELGEPTRVVEHSTQI
jgi:hypothetical protein